MARDSDVSTHIDDEAQTLTITVKGYAPIIVNPDQYPAELVAYAALHGFKQKYVDASALSAGSSLADKHAAIMKVVEHHKTTGAWNRNNQGDGTAGDGLLLRAIMAFDGCDKETARALVGKMDKKMQAKMRASAELKPIIERLRAEREPKPTPGFDASSVLAQLRKAA